MMNPLPWFVEAQQVTRVVTLEFKIGLSRNVSWSDALTTKRPFKTRCWKCPFNKESLSIHTTALGIFICFISGNNNCMYKIRLDSCIIYTSVNWYQSSTRWIGELFKLRFSTTTSQKPLNAFLVEINDMDSNGWAPSWVHHKIRTEWTRPLHDGLNRHCYIRYEHSSTLKILAL